VAAGLRRTLAYRRYSGVARSQATSHYSVRSKFRQTRGIGRLAAQQFAEKFKSLSGSDSQNSFSILISQLLRL